MGSEYILSPGRKLLVFTFLGRQFTLLLFLDLRSFNSDRSSSQVDRAAPPARGMLRILDATAGVGAGGVRYGF